ncbi:MAG: hypothetical protein EBY51_05595 [Actinobacteria bacterium]|nr:hypothetical protein [Actinomycetota bacterium]
MRVFGLCVVDSGGDGACGDGADMGVVSGPGVFDDGGAVVVPVAESDGESTGASARASARASAGGAVAGRATGTVCGVLGG